MGSIRTYKNLIKLRTFDERFEYLRLRGMVGSETFGSNRYINQKFYNSPEWKRFRRDIIIRDDGCDMALEGYEIGGKILIHHINPITQDDILERNELALMDPNNVVCVSNNTHQAIHYDNENLNKFPRIKERFEDDMIPWR